MLGYRFEVTGFSSTVVSDRSPSTSQASRARVVGVNSPNSNAKPTVATKISSHRDLVVWQKAMDYVDFVYDTAKKLPPEERFGLWSQLTRAAVSVPANITEGHARFTRKDFAYFLVLARSSLMETDTLLTICKRRGYISEREARAGYLRIEEISKMLTSLRRKLLGDWRKQNNAAA